MKLTSKDMSGFGLVDDVIPEPFGGAHTDPAAMAATLKTYLTQTLTTLNKIPAEQRILERINKFSKMGFYEEV